MSLLMIATFDETGYGQASTSWAKSLNSIGEDVVVRSVKMSNSKQSEDPVIKTLQEKDLNNITTVIQHNLPNTFSWKQDVQNILAFCFESELETTGWKSHIELADKVLVSCGYDFHRVCELVPEKGGKIYIVPYAVDLTKFTLEYPKNNFGLPEDCLKFYTIAEYNERKNFDALITAYYCNFSSSDNVALIIKTNNEAIKQLINDKKKTLRRFANVEFYPKILLITDQMSEFDLNTIHVNADIFISTSRGESWSLPSIDAFGFGNKVIAPAAGSFLDYKYYGINIELIETKAAYCDKAQSLDFLYTGNQTWQEINEIMLGIAMKKLASEKNKKAIHNFQVIKDNLSFEVVGRKLKEVIDAK